MSGADTRGTVTVNGQTRPLAVSTLGDLLRQLGHDTKLQGIAVAVNDELVPRAEWEVRTIEAGDRVEIVGAVQGG